MRQNFSVDKQITFNNSECLTQQTTVYSENIVANSEGKKIIKSGNLLYKDVTDKTRILKRYNPINNTTVATTGTLTLKTVDNISIGDKLDLLFPAYVITFAAGTGTVTFTLGDLTFTFELDSVPATSITNFVTAYNASIGITQNHTVTVLNTTKLLITSKALSTETPSFSPATGITTTSVKGVHSDSIISGLIGTITAINYTSKTVTYTATATFADCALGNVSIQITTTGQGIKQVLGFVNKDYDLTNHTTKIIPLLTSSRGVYKQRISYFDEDLVTRFPKIEFI